MDEIIDKDEIKQIIGEEIETDKKQVSIISDGKQMSIRIPKKYAEEAELTSDDKFEFELIPTEGGFDLIGRVIKHS